MRTRGPPTSIHAALDSLQDDPRYGYTAAFLEGAVGGNLQKFVVQRRRNAEHYEPVFDFLTCHGRLLCVNRLFVNDITYNASVHACQEKMQASMRPVDVKEFVNLIQELWVICGGSRDGGSKKLSKIIGVHFTTIDRWKGGKINPEKLSVAQVNRVIEASKDMRNKIDLLTSGTKEGRLEPPGGPSAPSHPDVKRQTRIRRQA